MRLWLSKNSEVPLREQLATQMLLGILSEDLKPGRRLPSTRELATRLHVHPNTVSAAYRDLERRGWVEYRKGSGVYVPETRSQPPEARSELDQLIASFFEAARRKGFTLVETQSRLKQWLEIQPPDHFLVIEPDIELRRILAAEIADATGFPVREAGLEECSDPSRLAGAAPVFLFNKEKPIRALLPVHTQCLMLHSRSVPTALQEKAPIPQNVLIAVVSRWPEFLKWARTVLVAAGVSSEALCFCDARKPGWQKRLSGAAAVIADALTLRSLPPGLRVHIFRLIADTSIAELRAFVQQTSQHRDTEGYH